MFSLYRDHPIHSTETYCISLIIQKECFIQMLSRKCRKKRGSPNFN